MRHPTMLAYVIPCDPAIEAHACFLKPHPMDSAMHDGEVSYLPSMYQYIGCTIVEQVPCMRNTGTRCVLWCDEEALCKAHPMINVRASILAGHEIYGNAILAGDDGERTVQCAIERAPAFFAMLEMLASTVSAVMANGTNEEKEE